MSRADSATDQGVRSDPWRYAGWIALLICAALYYPRYAKSIVNFAVYVKGADCFWGGHPIIACAPDFTYPPALALLMLPFVPLPPWLALVVWYFLSIGAAAACIWLCEVLTRSLYPVAADERNLIWFGAITLVFGLKFISSVLNYQSYDLIVFALILAGLWMLAKNRSASAGSLLAVATAIKATPLIFLPYLLYKRRFTAAIVFILVLAIGSVLPDLFNALRGLRSDYLQNWIAQVAGPALTPGGTSKQLFWQTWMGQSADNLSLRGVLHRMAGEPIFGLQPGVILVMAYAAVMTFIAALVALSPRRADPADDLIAVDGSILLVGMLALSPISSRYHFVLLMLPFALLVGASLCDTRVRTLGVTTLFATFMLTMGISNDLTGAAIAEYAHAHGFLLMGALILFIPLAAIVLMWPPPARGAA
jgi:glycosyl transferase family 87